MAKEKATKYINSELDLQEVKNYIDFLKQSGSEFSVIMSNYTTTIKSKFINIRFMKEEKSLTFFARTKELKKQVDLFLQTTELDRIKDPVYYDVNEVSDFITSEVINIDLSSAYLHVLFNNAIIDETLFDKLKQLPKQDRLGIVGMLASKKQEFIFNKDGELQSVEKIENEQQRNVFFYCVYVVNYIMMEVKKLLGPDYIFTWVDGIYFRDGKHIEPVQDFLNGLGYPYKVDVLQNFEFYRSGNIVEIDFLKNNKKKSFKIPLEKNNIFADEVYNYINKTNKK